MLNGSRSRQVLSLYHFHNSLLIGLHDVSFNVLTSIVVKINHNIVTKQPHTTTTYDKYTLLQMGLNWQRLC